jgi:L-threonylcarbamoyladenylate synthase
VSDVELAVAAIRREQPVVLPTDTVYGLCASPHSERSARALYRLKGREEGKPTALLAADLEALLDCLPELHGRADTILRALLPGPYTLVVPNPAGRFRWLAGSNPDAIGVRVPSLTGPAREVIAQVGVVTATSANLAGGPDPRRLDEVPAAIRDGAGAVIDGGELPGTPSTVLDFTDPEPRVLREGAASGTEALERALAALES